MTQYDAEIEAATAGVPYKKCFTNFTEKHLCLSLFFLKRCFPGNFAKFVITSFLQHTSGRLLL